MLERASITFRLSLLFAVASVLMLAGIGAYLYRSLEDRFAQRDTAELVGKVELVRYILSGTSSRRDVPSRRQDFAHVVVGHPSLYLAVLDEAGEALFASSSLRLPGITAPSDRRMMRVGSSRPRLGSISSRE